MASRKLGTLYTGVTNDLVRRGYEHREGLAPCFTQRHAVSLLVWFESHLSVEAAILQEKRIKRWRRDWKIKLVEEANPDWSDLWPSLSPWAARQSLIDPRSSPG